VKALDRGAGFVFVIIITGGAPPLEVLISAAADPHGDIAFVAKNGEIAILGDDGLTIVDQVSGFNTVGLGSARGHFGVAPFGVLGKSCFFQIAILVKVALDAVTSACGGREEVVDGLAIFETILLIAGTTDEIVGPKGVSFEPCLIPIAKIALTNVAITAVTMPK